jgi:hypothetical protein
MVVRPTARRGWVASLAVLLLGLPGIGGAQSRPPSEYQVKAVFLYEFGRFVEWPSLPQSPEQSFNICVLGVDPFGIALDDVVKNKSVAGHEVVVRRLVGVSELGSCQILFVSPSEQSRLPTILNALVGKSVLTVGEGAQFARRGGMISFTIENNRVRFAVNRTAAETADLRVSSQLLRLATLIETERSGS